MPNKHNLERLFKLSANNILTVVEKNNRCLMAVKGAVAQEHLERYLARLKKSGVIKDFCAIDKDGEPDFWVIYRGKKFLIECKNVQKTLRRGEITVDFMRTRYAKSVGPEGRFYKPSEFHVLAACLHNQTGKWKFRFIATKRLGRHSEYRGRLDNKVSLGKSKRYFKWWAEDLTVVLEWLRKNG